MTFNKIEIMDSTLRDGEQTNGVSFLPNQTVTNEATGNSEKFDINAYKKYCLENALDDIDL